jgi:hypothetical protein
MISCFGPPPKKSKKGKKPTSGKGSSADKSTAAAADMKKHRDVLAYVTHDGTWCYPIPPESPSYRFVGSWWNPSDFFGRSEWTKHQKALDDTLEKAKGNDEKLGKLKDSINDFRDVHDAHAKKQDECLAGIQKISGHLEAEAKKRGEQELARYWRYRLDESYEAGRRDEKEKSLPMQPKLQNEEDSAKELRALREELESAKQERLKQQRSETQRKDNEQTIERILSRYCRIEEEERERLDKLQKAEADRTQRLAERLWQERHNVDSKSDSFEREPRPYWSANPLPRQVRPRRRYHVGYTDAEDVVLPWMEETVEEEFPIYPPTSRRERRRTTLRGTARQPFPWDYS